MRKGWMFSVLLCLVSASGFADEPRYINPPAL